MTDPLFLRCPTLLQAFSAAGLSVSCITAKEKLRRLVGGGISGLSTSGERFDELSTHDGRLRRLRERLGRPAPGIYSGELSSFVLELGNHLLEQEQPDILYLSLTDYIPHRHPPGSERANRFFDGLDRQLAALDEKGLLAITADHGMNDKMGPDGAPRIVYLEHELDGLAAPHDYRVVLPITDPYVAHHGALGSFATIYFWEDSAKSSLLGRVIDGLCRIPGIEQVLTRDEASAQLQLPADRIGDLVLLGDQSTVFGKNPQTHDLSALEGKLRSHGGLHERTVPLFINRPLVCDSRLKNGVMHNYDVFDLAMNGAGTRTDS